MFIQHDISPLFLQRPLHRSFGAELVGDRSRTPGDFFQQSLERLGMAPGQQAIEIAKFPVQPIVAFRTDGDDVEPALDDGSDLAGQGGDSAIILDRL